jgi:Flp pilus assembly protein TadD
MAISRARLLANAALQAAQERDWQSATAQLREAITLCGECPDRAALRRNLGLILAQAGDFAAAKTELRLAQQFDPNDRDTNLALAILERQR